MTKITIKQEKICLFLLIPANVLYVVALFSHAWFKLPGVSYGLWWAVFCDYLACNIVPAFFTEEPVWYHIVQLLSLIGWCGMILSLMMMFKHFTFIDKYNIRRQQAIAVVCILSGFTISLLLMMFYGKLDEMSTAEVPNVHWSAILAGVAGLLQFINGLLLVQ